MQKHRLARLGVLAAAAASVAMMSVPAFAQRPFLEAVKTHLQLAQAIAKCTFCHGAKKGPSKTNLNDFGKAIQSDPDMKALLNKNVGYEYSQQELATVLKVVDKLADKDSDGDGATNREEWSLGTFPGDAKSTPPQADLEKFRKDHAKDAKPAGDAAKK